MAKIKKLVARTEPYNGDISLSNFVKSFKEDYKGFRCENLKVNLLEYKEDGGLSMEGKIHAIPLKKSKTKTPTLTDIYNLVLVLVNDVAELKSDVAVLKSDVALIKQCPTIKKELSELDSNNDNNK